MRAMLVIAVFSSLCFSQEKPFTLKDCIDMGFKNSVELKISFENLKQSDLSTKKYFAPFLPSVDFSFANNLLGYDAGGNDIVFGTVNPSTYNSSVSVNYNFFNMFKDVDSYSYYQKRYLGAELSFASIKQDVAYEIISSYYRVLNSEKTLQVRKKALAQKIEYLKLAESLFRSGIKSKSDYLNAQIQIKKSEVSLLDSENDLKAVRARLNNLLGILPENETNLTDDIEYLQPDYSLEKLTRNVFEGNYDWKKAKISREAVAISTSLEERALWPSIGIDGNFSVSLSRYMKNSLEWTHNGRLDQNASWGVGLSISYPIFDGAINSIKYQLSRSALDIEDFGIEALKRDLLEKTYIYYNNIMKVFEELSLYKEQVILSRESMDLIQSRYRSGISSFLDLTDAELNYISAEIGYYQMIYSYKTQKYDIERLSGIKLLW